MVVRQGDVVWVDLPRSEGSAPSGRRPAVVLQSDRFNRSAINTIVVVAVTSSLRLAALPGNVRLARGEAGVSRASVVNVSQIATIDRAAAVERLGSVSAKRLREIWEGVRLVIEPQTA